MALLTSDIQEKLVNLLIEEGLVAEPVLKAAQDDAAKTNKPLLAVLTEQGVVDDELLTHAIAQVSGVPYVNLMNSLIDQDVLTLLPEDIAERWVLLLDPMLATGRVSACEYFAKEC